MKLRHCTSICVAVAALGLAGCETVPPYSASPATYPAYPGTAQYPPTYPPVGYNFGYVESVEVLPTGATSSSGLPGGIGIGAIGGAIAGGVLGNQIGHGAGRAAATVGGAVAGGVVGNEIEKRVTNRAPGTLYRFRVRMDDGSYQTVTQEDHQDIRVGDRVRVDNGRVFAG